MLHRALRSLPPRQRAAVVLRVVDDLSELETSRALGCSVGTVKSLTSRGLARLRMTTLRDTDVSDDAICAVPEGKR
jgi:RNA polymerase sigma factor (sigma-70 family)